nr:MAG TPA: hypothetical protein [Caudoviricetes sp.]
MVCTVLYVYCVTIPSIELTITSACVSRAPACIWVGASP